MGRGRGGHERGGGLIASCMGTHIAGGMDACVCVVGNPGGGGQGRGPCKERVPAPGPTLLVPLGGVGKEGGRGQHEVSPFPPPHAYTPCARCWSTSAGEGAVWGGGVLPIE